MELRPRLGVISAQSHFPSSDYGVITDHVGSARKWLRPRVYEHTLASGDYLLCLSRSEKTSANLVVTLSHNDDIAQTLRPVTTASRIGNVVVRCAHKHPLIFFEARHNSAYVCDVCKIRFERKPVFACKLCVSRYHACLRCYAPMLSACKNEILTSTQTTIGAEVHTMRPEDGPLMLQFSVREPWAGLTISLRSASSRSKVRYGISLFKLRKPADALDVRPNVWDLFPEHRFALLVGNTTTANFSNAARINTPDPSLEVTPWVAYAYSPDGVRKVGQDLQTQKEQLGSTASLLHFAAQLLISGSIVPALVQAGANCSVAVNDRLNNSLRAFDVAKKCRASNTVMLWLDPGVSEVGDDENAIDVDKFYAVKFAYADPSAPNAAVTPGDVVLVHQVGVARASVGAHDPRNGWLQCSVRHSQPPPPRLGAGNIVTSVRAAYLPRWCIDPPEPFLARYPLFKRPYLDVRMGTATDAADTRILRVYARDMLTRSIANVHMAVMVLRVPVTEATPHSEATYKDNVRAYVRTSQMRRVFVVPPSSEENSTLTGHEALASNQVTTTFRVLFKGVPFVGFYVDLETTRPASECAYAEVTVKVVKAKESGDQVDDNAQGAEEKEDEIGHVTVRTSVVREVRYVSALKLIPMPLEEKPQPLDLKEATDYEQCPICMGSLCNGEPLGVLRSRAATNARTCRHFVHVACLSLWHRSKGSCPNCRTPGTVLSSVPSYDRDPEGWFEAMDFDQNGSLSRQEIMDALQATVPVPFDELRSDVDRFFAQWSRGGGAAEDVTPNDAGRNSAEAEGVSLGAFMQCGGLREYIFLRVNGYSVKPHLERRSVVSAAFSAPSQ